LIQRTSRGRMATEAGYRHLKIDKKGGGTQPDLL
jgi:Holliday junction resolvasome RuvABC ATP-dependent DNA helicase subunit